MEQHDADMNQNLNIRSRQQDQDKNIGELKNKISFNSFQMLQLTNNDQKFIDKVFQLNQKAISRIESGQYEEALIYLGQAQKLLQYAASCGRSIDREIIIKILNNQAVVYQKSYDLQKSISYIEAIIFNLKTFLNLKQNVETLKSFNQISIKIQKAIISQEQIQQFFQSHFQNLKSLISKKFSQALYYLQFSTLNSHNQDHSISLDYGTQSIQIFQQTFKMGLIFSKMKKILNNNLQSNTLKLLQQIVKISVPQINQYDKYFNYMNNIQQLYEKKSHTPNSFTYLLQKYSSLEKKEAKYKNFSLAQVVQIHTQSFRQKILDQQKIVQPDFYLQQIESQVFLIEKILQLSVSFFTVSVQTQELQKQNINQLNKEIQISEKQQHIMIKKKAKIFYIISLKISIQIIQELTQFSRYIYKHYFQIYQVEQIFNSKQSLTKMDTLKQKYKKYIPGQNNSQNCQSDSYFQHTIQQYTPDVKIQLNGKDKQNKLQKLFKQKSKSSQQVTPALPPPRLNIDLSQIQSLQYGGSRTFKQNYQMSAHQHPPVVRQQQQYNAKQTKKFNTLSIKKIKTVPNLSDVSSNRSQMSQNERSQPQKSKSKSKSSISPFKDQKRKINKSKSKCSKPIQLKKNTKLTSTSSKHKLQLRKFVSPKIKVRKPFQNNLNNNQDQNFHNQTKQKSKKLTQRKIFSDRKILINDHSKDNNCNILNDKSNQKDNNIKQKKKLQFRQKKKKKLFISPQPSHQKISQQKEQADRQKQKKPSKQKQKSQQTNKLRKLRKVKSFQQIIEPFQQLKQMIENSKQKLSQTNNLNNQIHKIQRLNTDRLLKKHQQIQKTKCGQNFLRHTVKRTVKKDKKSPNKEGKEKKGNHHQTSYQNKDNFQSSNFNYTNTINMKETSQRKMVKQAKKQCSAITKKKKNSSSSNIIQSRSLVGLPPNAIRMSSNLNLINSTHDRHNGLNKSKSSKSLFESQFGSEYLVKGLKSSSGALQRMKSGSLAITASIKRGK